MNEPPADPPRPEDEPAALGVDALIARLADEGEVDSAGRFTVDRKVARERLQRFQLPEVARYVLELARAAVLQGATRLVWHIDTDDVRVGFDGPAFTVTDFEQMFDALVDASASATPSLAPLAIGLNVALGARARFARIVSRDGNGGAAMTLRPGHADELGPLPPLTPPTEPAPFSAVVPTTVVHVKLGTGLGLLWRAWESLSEALPEAALLQRHCRYMSARVELAGNVISKGAHLPKAIGVLSVQGPHGAHGRAGFSYGLGQTPRLHVLVHDVLVVSERLLFSPPYFHAIVRCDALELDLSRADVVRDEVYDDLLTHLRGVVPEARAELARAFGVADPTPDILAAWNDEVVQTALHLYRYQWAKVGSTNTSAIHGHLYRVRRFPTVRVVWEPLSRRYVLDVARSVALKHIAHPASAGLEPGYLPRRDSYPPAPLTDHVHKRYLVLADPAERRLLKAIFGEALQPVSGIRS